MNLILTTLAEMNITDPTQVRRIAWLIVNAANGSSIESHAEQVIAMTEQDLELATQQILGGR
jgi:hypothetical protein